MSDLSALKAVFRKYLPLLFAFISQRHQSCPGESTGGLYTHLHTIPCCNATHWAVCAIIALMTNKKLNNSFQFRKVTLSKFQLLCASSLCDLFHQANHLIADPINGKK
jgi:hypothetical protein